MDFEWVRSRQPAGGTSKWHLLAATRSGLLSPRGLAAIGAGTYALTRCGFLLTPFETTLGMVAARYHPDVLLPLDGRGRPVPEYGKGNICEKCADLGQLLATSTPATGRP